MTSHSLNLANDVVNLTRQKDEIQAKIHEARAAVVANLKEIATAAGMNIKVSGVHDVGFYWPNS